VSKTLSRRRVIFGVAVRPMIMIVSHGADVTYSSSYSNGVRLAGGILMVALVSSPSYNVIRYLTDVKANINEQLTFLPESASKDWSCWPTFLGSSTTENAVIYTPLLVAIHQYCRGKIASSVITLLCEAKADASVPVWIAKPFKPPKNKWFLDAAITRNSSNQSTSSPWIQRMSTFTAALRVPIYRTKDFVLSHELPMYQSLLNAGADVSDDHDPRALAMALRYQNYDLINMLLNAVRHDCSVMCHPAPSLCLADNERVCMISINIGCECDKAYHR
jgi:hypothetical protein